MLSNSSEHARGLPDELLEIIVDYVHPGDIVAFAVSCRHFHALSAQRLLQHHQYHAEYSHTIVSGRSSAFNRIDREYDHPLELLVELEQNPSLGFYIQMLEYDEMLDDWSTELAASADYDFPTLYSLSPLLQHDLACRERSIAGIRKGDPNDCLMLILSVATEVSHVRTWHGMHGRYWLSEAPLESIPFCQKLRWVQAGSLLTDGRDITSVLYWARLPALQTLLLDRTEYNVRPQGIDHWPPRQRVSLSTFALVDCKITGQGLAEILAGLTDLESFTYTAFQCFDHGGWRWQRHGNWQWETHLAIDALKAAASHTLRSLDIRMVSAPEDRIVSLKDFTNLEYFCGPIDLLPHCHVPYTVSVRSAVIIDLGAIFPASLVHLSLNTRVKRLPLDPRPRTIDLCNFESFPRLAFIVLTPCIVRQETLHALSARNIAVRTDWAPNDIPVTMGWARDDHLSVWVYEAYLSLYERTLPRKWWSDPIHDDDDAECYAVLIPGAVRADRGGAI